MSQPQPPESVLPPWTLKGDVYLFSWWTSKSKANNLPPHTYSPLEGQSSFADTTISKPSGGLSMVQLIRYTESPVGPYDEFILVPGNFSWTKEDKDGRRITGHHPKITRIYVSQKHTCYNGRKNWNVPKHLAKFDFIDNPDGSTTIQVFPHDTVSGVDHVSAESASPSPVPFFRTTFKPISYVPSFRFATHWINYFGLDVTLHQPPLPSGNGSQAELGGTDKWCSVIPLQSSKRCILGWFDINQGKETSNEVNVNGGYENFWPGLGKWQFGMKMEKAEITFDHPDDVWDTPKSNL